MTDVLRVVLVVIGVVLALLAAWVVAPDGPIREGRAALASLKRILGIKTVSSARVHAVFATTWATAVNPVRVGERKATDSIDLQLQALHDHLVELSESVVAVDGRIRKLSDRVGTVAGDVETLARTVVDNWTKYQENEERSSQLDATGVLPAVVGILLGAVSEPLAAAAWIGIPSAVIGIGLAVRCTVVLWAHLRQRRSLTTGAGTTATS